MPYVVSFEDYKKKAIMSAFIKAGDIAFYAQGRANIMLSQLHKDISHQSDYEEYFFHFKIDYAFFKENGFIDFRDGRIFFSEKKKPDLKSKNYVAILLHNPLEDIVNYENDDACIDWVYVSFSKIEHDFFLKKYPKAKIISV